MCLLNKRIKENSKNSHFNNTDSFFYTLISMIIINQDSYHDKKFIMTNTIKVHS